MRVSSGLRGTTGGAMGGRPGDGTLCVACAPHQTKIVRRVHLLIRRCGPPSSPALGRDCPRVYPVAFEFAIPLLCTASCGRHGGHAGRQRGATRPHQLRPLRRSHSANRALASAGDSPRSRSRCLASRQTVVAVRRCSISRSQPIAHTRTVPSLAPAATDRATNATALGLRSQTIAKTTA